MSQREEAFGVEKYKHPHTHTYTHTHTHTHTHTQIHKYTHTYAHTHTLVVKLVIMLKSGIGIILEKYKILQTN